MAERLISTDGSGREFIRNGSEWVAYFPDRKHGPGRAARPTTAFHRRPARRSSATTGRVLRDPRHRAPAPAGPRLARDHGRAARRIALRLPPLDRRKTGDAAEDAAETAGDQIIEEIAFVSLSLPSKIDDELLKPDIDASGFRWLRRDAAQAARAVPESRRPRRHCCRRVPRDQRASRRCRAAKGRRTGLHPTGWPGCPCSWSIGRATAARCRGRCRWGRDLDRDRWSSGGRVGDAADRAGYRGARQSAVPPDTARAMKAAAALAYTALSAGTASRPRRGSPGHGQGHRRVRAGR